MSDDVAVELINGDLVNGKPFLVNLNENDSCDCARIGFTFPLHCSVKELYPLIPSTVLAFDDSDTFKIGTS